MERYPDDVIDIGPGGIPAGRAGAGGYPMGTRLITHPG